MADEEKPKRISVRVVGIQGESALVEWDGRRGYVPQRAIKDGTVTPTTLKKAIPYGVPWDELAEGLAARMYSAGIWTKKDLAQNMQLAWELARPWKLGLSDLNRFAHKEG
jgi:hypothetical protein